MTFVFLLLFLVVFMPTYWYIHFPFLFPLSYLLYLFTSSDISLIYHMIRGQGTIKLYVVYNVLEVRKFILYQCPKFLHTVPNIGVVSYEIVLQDH